MLAHLDRLVHFDGEVERRLLMQTGYYGRAVPGNSADTAASDTSHGNRAETADSLPTGRYRDTGTAKQWHAKQQGRYCHTRGRGNGLTARGKGRHSVICSDNGLVKKNGLWCLLAIKEHSLFGFHVEKGHPLLRFVEVDAHVRDFAEFLRFFSQCILKISVNRSKGQRQ